MSALVTDKDIANARARQWRKDLSAMCAVEALFEQLKGNNFYFKYEVNEESSRLQYLLSAHPQTLALYAHHPDALVLDCTYNTNAYDLPLLNVIAITAMNSIVPVA